MALKSSFVILALALVVDCRRVAKQQRQANLVQDMLGTSDTPTDANFNPFYSFQQHFKGEGFTEKDIAKLQARFYEDTMPVKKWPLRDHTQELVDSVTNFANDNNEGVKKAIAEAGGRMSDVSSLTDDVIAKAEANLGKCTKEQQTTSISDASSMLEQKTSMGPFPDLPWVAGKISSNSGSISLLSNTMNMLSGSVATNTGAVAGLTAAVGQNTAAISAISGQVGLMSQVAGPTTALASALGVAPGTVATLAMAGSFVGPLLGVIALIYVAWPEEEIDPWLKVEARVSRMITDKFDANRRKRLGDRLRRYIRQFAKCAKAWVATSMVKANGVALPKWIVEDAKSAKASGNFNFTSKTITGSFTHSPKFPAPPCMEELEGHMSLERDEWFESESGTLSGLFMPFANMHTQMLSMLADHPYDDKMAWRANLKSTAAEYGAHMAEHILGAWKAQVCRTMRLRHSIGGLGTWKYQWVVLKQMSQPHASENCWKKCGETSGWCDWCGGKELGACCKKGETSDGGVCKQFDPPLNSGLLTTSANHVCVHNDCIQSNSAYVGTELKKVEGEGPILPEDCQQICQDLPGSAAFTTSGNSCTCLKKDGLTRHQENGAQSGPIVCGVPDDSLEAREAAYERNLVETPPNVPMEEVEPCDAMGKSPPVKNYKEVEEKHHDWAKQCQSKAAEVVTGEFNKFYKRMGKFLKSMAWQAGCGAQSEVQWDHASAGHVSKEFDAGSFGDCDWDREAEMDKKMVPWAADNDERARGWTKTSRINMDEQRTVTMEYPMPKWLSELKRQVKCLKNSAAGKVADNDDARSTSINTMLESATMTEDNMATSSIIDVEFDNAVRAAP